MTEFRRIFGRWHLWVLVAAAVCCNVFLFGQTQQKEYGTAAGFFQTTPQGLMEEYERQLAEYAPQTPEEAYEKCLAAVEAEDGTGIWNIEFYVRKNYVLPFMQYRKEYPEYLEQVQENAVRLRQFRIFAEDGAFSKRNITATAEDFQQLDGIQPEIGNYYGVKAFLEYRIADYLVVLLMLFVCWQMLAERKKGLWSIVRLTGGGRWKLAWKRIGIFVCAGLIFSFLLYASTLLADISCFGRAELSVPAQSMPELAKLPVRLTMGEFLGQYLVVKAAGTLLLSLVLWLILSAVANTAVAMAAAGLVMAVEYVLFAFLPVQSFFNLFKYCNLFSYFYLDRLYQNYLNMNFFGVPVNARELLLGLLPVLLVLGTAAVLAINGRKRIEGRQGLLLRLYEWIKRRTDWLTSHLNGFGMECYKLLFVQKGLLFFIALVWLMGRLFPVWGGIVPIEKNMQELRQEEWEGAADDPAVRRLLEEEKAELTNASMEYEQIRADYEAGKATVGEMQRADFQLMSIRNRQEAYDAIQSDLTAMRRIEGIRPWIMNDKWLEVLFEEDSVQRELGLLALLLLTLLLAPVYAYEEQTGARIVLRGSGKGRMQFVCRKQLVTLVMVVLVWGIVYGMNFWSVVRFHGVHGLAAPIQAVTNLRGSDWKMTVRGFLILVYGLRLLVLWAAAQILLLLSSYGRKVQTATLGGIFLVVMPSALWTIGVKALEFVSIVYPLSVIEILRKGSFCGWSSAACYLLLALAGIGCLVWTSRKWIRDKKI